MSLGRKKNDGNISGGSTGIAERRDTFHRKSPAFKHASSKRAKYNPRRLDEDDLLFAEESDKDRYLITYADLITLLLGLFIILYAISNVDVPKYHKMISAIESAFGAQGKVIGWEKGNPGGNTLIADDKLRSDLKKLLAEYRGNNALRLEENERGITIHILDDVLFSSGSSVLTEGSKSVLNKLANIIKKLPNDIRIEGHTDNVPIHSEQFPSNWHLSVARALNTAYYLIHNEGLEPDKVSIVGYSEYKPIAPNKTAEGKALNRRVDIVIIKNRVL